MKFLIVEDDSLFANQLKLHLRHLGYSLFSIALTAEDALEKAEVFQPDILIVAIKPGTEKESIEMANHIRQRHEISVIYLTSPVEEKIFNRIMKSSPQGYLIKPFDEIELRIAIEIASQKHTLEMQLKESLTVSQKREKEIAELLHATNSILSNNEFEITAKLIFDACKRSIGAKAGYVALLNEAKDDNELLFLEDGGFRCNADPHLPMPIRGLRAEVYQNGKVAYDNEYMKSEHTRFLPQGHMSLPNVLFAPLNIDGQTVGLLGLSHKNGEFTDSDAQLAGAFGDYAAIALKNSKTYSELKKVNQRLTQLNETKDKFFSIISHDLRGAFNSILTGAKLLRRIDELEQGEIKQIGTEMDKLAKNQFQLLENLLEWAQLQSGSFRFQPSVRDLGKIIAQTIDLFSEQARLKNISLVVDIPEPITVYVDVAMIETVFRNVVSNAIKFTNAGGTVSINARKSNQRARITVSDDGIGIPEVGLQQLFRIDSRFKKYGTAGEKGTGLGLILCQEFVEKNSGTIDVKSSEGQGTDFIITLPVRL